MFRSTEEVIALFISIAFVVDAVKGTVKSKFMTHTRNILFFSFCELFTRCLSVVKIKSSSLLTQHTCCRICRKLVSDVISKPRKIKKIKAFTATYIHIIMCKWILRLSFKWAAESHKISSTNHLVLLIKNCQIVSSSVCIFLLQSSAPLKI